MTIRQQILDMYKEYNSLNISDLEHFMTEFLEAYLDEPESEDVHVLHFMTRFLALAKVHSDPG